MRATAFAIDLLRCRAKALENGLDQAERDFAFTGEHPIGAGFLHIRQISKIRRARENLYLRVQLASHPNHFGGIAHPS